MSRSIIVLVLLFVLACELPEDSPEPTATPWSWAKAVSTPRPEPTARLVVAPSPRQAGTLLSLSDISPGFESLGPKFHSDRALDDNDNVVDHHVWYAPNTLVVLTAWGPPSNLTKIRLTIGIDPDQGGTQAMYINLFLDSVFFDWVGSVDWVSRNIDLAVSGAKPQTHHGNLNVLMDYLDSLKWLEITITGR